MELRFNVGLVWSSCFWLTWCLGLVLALRTFNGLVVADACRCAGW